MGNFNNAYFKNMETNEEIKISFNPASYSISREASYKASEDKSGNNNPSINFQGGGKSTLSVEMDFAEEPDGEDVSEQVRRLEQFLIVQEKEGKKMPQKVAFIWGSLDFQGYISSIKTTYTRFTKDGKPIRAKASLQMESYEEPKKASKGGSGGVTIRTATEDMDIWKMSYEQYEDSSRWREIAKNNNITNPLNVEKGTNIQIS